MLQDSVCLFLCFFAGGGGDIDDLASGVKKIECPFGSPRSYFPPHEVKMAHILIKLLSFHGWIMRAAQVSPQQISEP